VREEPQRGLKRMRTIIFSLYDFLPSVVLLSACDFIAFQTELLSFVNYIRYEEEAFVQEEKASIVLSSGYPELRGD